MSISNNQITEQKDKEISPYHKIEIEEIFTRTRTLVALRIQIFSFIGTAHLTILGFAFTIQKATLIFTAASLMILLIAIDFLIKPVIDVVVARGLQIEKIYSNDEVALSSAVMLAALRNKRKEYILLSKIREVRTLDEIVKLIQSRPSNKIGVWLPLVLILLEGLAGLTLWKFNLLPLI